MEGVCPFFTLKSISVNSLNTLCLTKSCFIICGFEYGKINVKLILDEIYIRNTVYFQKLVKQCFVELLCKIRFLHALLQMNQIFIQKHREKVCISQYVVN